LEPTLERIEQLMEKRRWILDEIKKFEEKYNINSEDFYKKWVEGLLPEPQDPDMHSDFMIWFGLLEELSRIEEKLKQLIIANK